MLGYNMLTNVFIIQYNFVLCNLINDKYNILINVTDLKVLQTMSLSKCVHENDIFSHQYDRLQQIN